MSLRLLLPLAALALAVFIAFPALKGSAVYDDTMLTASPLMDGPEDVVWTFDRTLVDYQRIVNPRASAGLGAIYRPVAMATLVATQVWGRSMVAHHVVSVLLHALTAILAAFAVRRSGRPLWLAALVGGVVVAHPSFIEAFTWVFGRFDLLTGLAIAMVAVAFPARLDADAKPRWILGVFAMLVGALSKEAFVILAPAVALRGIFVRGGSTRVRVGALLAVAAPLVAAAMLRTHAARGIPTAIDAADVQLWLTRSPRLLAEAAATLIVPYGRAMRTLAFELGTPTSTMTIVGAMALGLGLATAVSERKAGVALVIVAAALSLVPTTHVADVFWLGFDRYLYAPAIAILIAAAEAWESAPATLEKPVRTAAIVGVLGLAVLGHLGSRAYASDASFNRAVRRERPADPSGVYLEASRLAGLRRLERAKTTLARAPRTTIAALERNRLLLELAFGQREEAEATITRLLRVRADDPFVAADGIMVAITRYEFSRLPDLAEVANERRSSRRTACEALQLVRAAPPSQIGFAREAGRILHCRLRLR